MVNLDIDVCYHYSQACTVQLQILSGVRLTKETCGVESGYAIPSKFTLERGKHENEQIWGKCQRDCTPTTRKTE